MIKIFVVDHSKEKGVTKKKIIELITEPNPITELITEPIPMVQTALIVLIIIIPVIRVNSVNETYSQIVAATTTLLKVKIIKLNNN